MEDLSPDDVRELDLYAENSADLYNQFQSIVANIRRRIKNGSYDPALAPKLWRYWYEAAAQVLPERILRAWQSDPLFSGS